MKKSAQNNRIKQIQFSKPFANKIYIFYTNAKVLKKIKGFRNISTLFIFFLVSFQFYFCISHIYT